MVALEQGDITQQKAHADVVHGTLGQNLLGQRHGGFAPFCFVPQAHQTQHGAVRKAQKGPVQSLKRWQSSLRYLWRSSNQLVKSIRAVARQ